MKALSIKQPWAALIAHGIKDVENRSRRTNYRGKILLHASAVPALRNNQKPWDLFSIPQWRAVQNRQLQAWYINKAWRNGAIIGEAEIVGCVNNSSSIWAEPGQWHWQIANARIYTFDEIITDVKGALGLWDFNQCGECSSYNACVFLKDIEKQTQACKEFTAKPSLL